MGKDHDIIQAVKDRDSYGLQKILTKLGKQSKNKLLGSSKKGGINYQDSDGMSALHQAALVGNLDMMQLLLENGSSVSIQDNKGMLALHYAAWQGKSEPVHMLLQWQSPTNEQAKEGEAPLHLACQHGHFDVVNLLLLHHANPTIVNKEWKTPLDLACEFGRYRVVDLLLRSNLCAGLLAESPNDMIDNNRTTCIHLAAKNGHIEIIRLLLQAGVNINRSTLRGTCLHEAALCGKTDVVKLLLDCGVDVNKSNSYDQTALDIVTTYTTTRAARDLKQLLKEASFAVKARAVKDFCDLYDTKSLAFREGDIIKVIEQGENAWKGVVISDNRRMSKPGYFPPENVVLIDSSDCHGYIHHHHDHNGALYLTGHHVHPQTHTQYSSNPESHNVNGRPFDNHNHVGEHNLHNHHGDWASPTPYSIVSDLRTASPAKGSPTNSNRNSAASSDSGRGYSTGHLEPKVTHNYANVQINNQHRLSGQSYESGVSSRQSYHSTSSSSVGSLDRLEEGGYSSQINVAELVHAGLPDHEVLRCWLRDLRFEDYHGNFLQAGYDMPTISRMTPEDLTAIGITKPGHRKRLKAEIARLNIHDGIPDHKPTSVMEWLHLLNLEQYHATLVNQGYDSVDYVTDITWEDLEEIGIQKLGHQKKIMLAIERLKRIMSGSKRLSTMDNNKRSSGEALEPPANNNTRWSAGEVMSSSYNGQDMAGGMPYKPRRSSSSENSNNANIEFSSATSSPFKNRHSSESSIDSCFLPPSPSGSSTSSYQPDVVAIQVKRSSSQSGPAPYQKESRDMSGQTITYQSFQVPATGQRLSDSMDRETTPTGDDMMYIVQGSPKSSLPVATVVPKAAIKPKPVAKIIAKTKRTSRECSPDIIDIEKHEIEKNQDVCHSPSHNGGQRKSDHIYDQPQIHNMSPSHKKIELQEIPGSPQTHKINKNGAVTDPIFVSTQHEVTSQSQNSPQQGSPSGKSRKVPPPPPPKRTNSITQRSDIGVKEQRSPHFAGSIPKSAIQGQTVGNKQDQSSHVKEQAFANCVQSLSQRFGRKREESCNSDEVCSSDGEEFPPPPPPVAMDIITPKLHNYGIPSKEEKSSMGSEYRHQGKPKVEHSMSPGTVVSSTQHSPAKTVSVNEETNEGNVESTFGVKLRTQPTVSVTAQGTPPPTPPPKSHGTIQGGAHSVSRTAPAVSHPKPSLPPKVSSVNGGHPPHPISSVHSEIGSAREKRKDSNPGLDLNTSTSSVDSNTLPFANENVGTIKQRTPTTKPSVVLISEELDQGNSHMFQHLSAGTHTVSSTHHPVTSHKESKKPVVPKKPGVAMGMPSGFNTAKPSGGDVLNDIDNMLQGLTDELDAMLEEEMNLE
ncbi:caskin-2-like [Ylistrum balloti]|uniref:caskin-2-like n=1 Tax=Ylistrum balloti TaxID=509963 RepID=UPI002905D272|nr:caskin-2-like [Ylistrum balloti]